MKKSQTIEKSLNQVTCPHCGHKFDIEESLKATQEEEIAKAVEEERLKFQEEISKMAEERKVLISQNEQKQKELQAQLQNSEKLQKDKYEKELEILTKKLREEFAEEKIRQAKDIKAKMEKDKETEMKLLQNELEENKEKLNELAKLKIENSKLEREKISMRETLEVEMQQKLNADLEKEKEAFIKNIETKHNQEIAILQKKYDDQIKLTEEMKKKQEQGSMQLQGEVQELSIENWLKDNFKFDEINEIGKGVNGADCIQYVEAHRGKSLGTIYYESKNAQNFSNDWISKFKKDMKLKGADIGVLVTSVYPKDMDRMGLKDGIYICNMFEFKGLCTILRNEIIKLSRHKSAQENKQDKKEMLYNYLTSNEFEMHIRGIIDGFTAMRTDLEKEKNAMMKYWQHREKQLDMVLESTNIMCGSIKSISGNMIQGSDPLDELPGGDEILAIEDKSKKRKKK